MKPSSLARALGVLLVCAVALPASAAADPPVPPEQALQMGIKEKVSRYTAKPAGTTEKMRFWYGPYTVPPGWDANRFDVDLPLQNGYVTTIEPGMKRTTDLTEPAHQEAHIHHAHWFGVQPGNKNDTYFYGLAEWFFGNGDEETRADLDQRSAADPNGPRYGGFLSATQPQTMIYMLHNKTSQPLVTWIVLDVTFTHGTKKELAAKGGRPWHDLTGVLYGRTYSVPREPNGDGVFETGKDSKPIEWTSTVDGTMIGTGGHLHPGGLRTFASNMGSKENPCTDDNPYGGTRLYQGDALFRHNVLFSEDFQMAVTNPAWRAPIHKGDVIRLTGVYENKDHGWYDVMTHMGIYIDEAEAPKGRCKPYLIGGVQEQKTVVKRKKHVHYRIDRRGKLVRKVHWHKTKVTTGIDPIAGVPNRDWGHHPDLLCGLLGFGPCDKPEQPRPPGRETNLVNIANFLYLPGDLSMSGEDGAPPRIKQGDSLTFVNADQQANIRHTVTTCPWPCNGGYVANYPLPDGQWDSGFLGYDVVDGGTLNPVASTPKDLAVGKYAYFCRIHPWMRGAFEVTP